MSLDAVYADSIEQGLQRWAANPGPEPEPGFSITSFLGSGAKGFPSAALESGGSLADVLSAFGTAAAASGGSAGGMFSLPTPAEQKQEAQARDRMLNGEAFDFSAGNAMRRKAQEFAPDPLTTHTADQVMHGLVRFGAKAVTDVGLMGPAGAILLGLDEGNTVTQNLRAEGVDTATAAKVGAVQGTVAGVSAVMPLGGRTIAQTIGLVGVGGPGSYMAQEHLSRRILEEAGYLDQASLHNPFDPLGLALSTVIPGGFGAMHMRGEFRRAEGVQAGTAPLQQLRPEELRALKYDDPRLDAYASATAEKYGVPPAIMLAIKNVGEKSDPTAVGPPTKYGKAVGVMQFLESTAKEMGLADRTDPMASIDAATRYMRKLHDAYGSWDAAITHYNGGGAQAAIVRGGGQPTATQTIGYLNRVRDYVSQHTAKEAAQHPEAVDAARVAVLNDTVQRSLPDTPDAVQQVQRAADIVGESGGRAAEREVPKLEGLDPWEMDQPFRAVEDLPQPADVAEGLRGMASAAYWAQRGGSMIRSSNTDEPGTGGMGAVVGRTTWIPAEEWFGRMRRAQGNDGLSKQEDIAAAVEKAIRNEPLNKREALTVEWIRREHDDMERAIRDSRFLPDDPALLAHDAFEAGLSSRDARDVAMVARAAEIDQPGVESAAVMHQDDDAAFMAAVKRILGEQPAADIASQGTDAGGAQAHRASGAAQAREYSGNSLPSADSVTLKGDEPPKRGSEGFQLTEAKPAQAQPDAKAAERQLVELRKRESVLQSLLECLEAA